MVSYIPERRQRPGDVRGMHYTHRPLGTKGDNGVAKGLGGTKNPLERMVWTGLQLSYQPLVKTSTPLGGKPRSFEMLTHVAETAQGCGDKGS